ncbi:MAG: 3-keto-disaccharide hydrolase [Prolixibacteraceae bacterium]
MKLFFFFLMFSFALNSCTNTGDDGWTELFNGKDLTGWKQLNGEAKFEAVDGMIVGTTVANTPNSFLCTEQDYSDFVLELEMFLEEDFNSGMQIRSESNPDYMDGRVHGYQCEVDPTDRAWSAGIFDEARRGWLYPVELNPEAKPAFKDGEWNHYRIECIGPTIRTWLNGVPVAHLIDDMTLEGFIGLQLHSIPDESMAGRQIRWKNIRIKTENLEPSPFEDIYVVNLLPNHLSEAEKEQGFQLLFDGNSTENFKSVDGEEFPSKGWKAEDGVLTVIGKDERTEEEKGGSIITKEEFGPFELKFDFMFTEGANSGIKYGLGNNGHSVGLEYQILDDENHPDAKNGIQGNRTLASLYDLIPAKKQGRFVNGPGEWNRGRIVLYPDNRVEHWLNGRKVVEFTRGSEEFKKLVEGSKFADKEGFGMAETGPIHIQDHNNTVHFRSLKIREF